ncbi:uncharacterized protein STEHIDRAFT_26719, partial [Stereum hirsutum FP-91666 SS1]|uniref:uncharacterized protein n=1 Tax=Stereum hirsutum (strain FP-91666) TaxID=721885 RepID=UPI000444977C
ISAPVEGTVIAPGQAFDFSYGIHADYCSSSYNYSVWLMTEMPQAFSPSPTFMTGYLFGTYDAANYPAVPYATNPAPAQLTMPDLSQDQGGWGSGASATNATFYVMVWEEWASCDASLGKRISLAMNSIIYNATAT